MNLGAFFQVYKNKKATEFVLDNFKKNFPSSKVVLISDGGDDFSDLATKYDCSYFRFENLYGNEENNYPILPWNSYRIKKWWERQKLTCEETGAEYIIILEDDVLVRDRFSIDTPFHLRGARIGNHLPEAMRRDIKEQGGLDSSIYGMCGGSIYNSKTFLSVYNSVIKDIDENHDMLLAKGYFELGAVDANITYHFGKRGYAYEASPWMVEMREGNTGGYPIVHQYKELY